MNHSTYLSTDNSTIHAIMFKYKKALSDSIINEWSVNLFLSLVAYIVLVEFVLFVTNCFLIQNSPNMLSKLQSTADGIYELALHL